MNDSFLRAGDPRCAMRSLRIVFPVLVWLGLVGVTAALSRQAPTPAAGAFAFPNTGGTRLLVVSELGDPRALKTALCADSGRVSIRFERRQPGREGHDGRQTPRNFDAIAGSVFRLVSGKLEEGETCFLAADFLLAGASVVPAARPGDQALCRSEARRRLASFRKRPIANCWSLGRLEKDGDVVLIEFARQAADALASIALVERNRATFADVVGKYRGKGLDLWRADDGGVLSPDGFRVVFALRRGQFRALAINWSGAEGDALSLLVADKGTRFTEAINEYWYRAPL